MIGPRRRAAGAPPPATAVGNRSSRPVVAAARSRSRSGSAVKKEAKGKDKGRKEKEKKEFAWMDSDDESDSAAKLANGKQRDASPASSSGRSRSSRSGRNAKKQVPLVQVETLSQMARLAPDLEKRLRHGKLRPRELMEVASALNRSKYFDAGLFEALADELRRAFKHKDVGAKDTVDALCWLADLNAYNARMFEAACDSLQADLARVEDSDRQRLEGALKRVNHQPSEAFTSALRKKKSGDGRQACPMFWRGQCKWGPKCKLSHDMDSFDDSAKEGVWKPPSQSGGKSVGFKQSSDLFKADRCGALW